MAVPYTVYFHPKGFKHNCGTISWPIGWTDLYGLVTISTPMTMKWCLLARISEVEAQIRTLCSVKPWPTIFYATFLAFLKLYRLVNLPAMFNNRSKICNPKVIDTKCLLLVTLRWNLDGRLTGKDKILIKTKAINTYHIIHAVITNDGMHFLVPINLISWETESNFQCKKW